MKFRSFLLLLAGGIATFRHGNGHAFPEPNPEPRRKEVAPPPPSTFSSAIATTTAGPNSGDSIPGWPDVPPDLIMAYAFIKNHLSLVPTADTKNNIPIITSWNNGSPYLKMGLLQMLMPDFWNVASNALRMQLIFLYITPMTPEEMGEDLHFPPLFTRFSDRDLPFYLASVDNFMSGGGLAELWNTPHDLIDALTTGNVDGLMLDITAVMDVATDGMFQMLDLLPSWLTNWVHKEVKAGLEWLFGDTKPAAPVMPPPSFQTQPNAVLVGGSSGSGL